MTTTQVMIDLETMSTRSDAAIVAIGAVKFDPNGVPGTWGDPDDPEYKDFYMAVDLGSAIDMGLHVDGPTVMWWLKQDGAVRDCLNDAVDIHTVLNEFMIWYGAESLPTWGNGAAFDCVILRNAYMKFGSYPPFSYTDERCFRTMRKVLPEVEWLKPVMAHHALEDARAQATHLQQLFQQLNKKG